MGKGEELVCHGAFTPFFLSTSKTEESSLAGHGSFFPGWEVALSKTSSHFSIVGLLS
jgi:hypothetical protein